MKVYIAGPLSDPDPQVRLMNVQKALHFAILLIHRGHVPFVPHFSHYLDLLATGKGMSITYEQWMAQDRVWLESCDALLFLGESPGANRELDWARELGLPIYRSIAEVGT